ncbi:MAG: YlxM family DNA-binding protein [Clostridia bacterium]|nr:YlxM family DNA-binding protein [Clostridia bacterium]
MAKNMEIARLYDFYGDMLADRQRDVMEQYYEQDLSLSEIAENTGISRQGVRDAIKRAEAQLLHLEDRLGLVKRELAQIPLLAAIAEDTAAIDAENDRIGGSDKIGTLTSRILARVQELMESATK